MSIQHGDPLTFQSIPEVYRVVVITCRKVGILITGKPMFDFQQTCEQKPTGHTEVHRINSKENRFLLIAGNLSISSEVKQPEGRQVLVRGTQYRGLLGTEILEVFFCVSLVVAGGCLTCRWRRHCQWRWRHRWGGT